MKTAAQIRTALAIVVRAIRETRRWRVNSGRYYDAYTHRWRISGSWTETTKPPADPLPPMLKGERGGE